MNLLALLIFVLQVMAVPLTPPDLTLCQADPVLYQTFGPNCTNPLRWHLDDYIPVNSIVLFQTPSGLQSGTIFGYYWDVTTQRYVYQIVQGPPAQIWYVGAEAIP